jgi:hypothetical protein
LILPGRWQGSNPSRKLVAEIVLFLEEEIEDLLKIILKAEEIMGGREESRSAGWSFQLKQQLATSKQHMGRKPTPQCVSYPKLLPAPDLSIVYEHIQRLRTQRRSLYEHTNIGTRKASEEFIDRVSEDLLEAIDAARTTLEEIYSSQIAFNGEKPFTASNKVTRSEANTIVQVGTVKEIHIHQQDSDADPDLANLIISTVDVIPGSWHADLLVDSDPPYAVTPSGSIYVITLQTRAKEDILLQGARPIVTSRQRPRRACADAHMKGIVDPRKFTTDLDSKNPQLHAEGAPFPFHIHSKETEQFWIQPTASSHEVSWKLEIYWIYLGNHGTTTIGSNDGTFEVYPSNSKNLTRCNLKLHERDCPRWKLNDSITVRTTTFSYNGYTY